jgi:methyl-accepting chemotaxis protein
MAMKIKTQLFILAGFVVIVEAIDIARIVAFSGSSKIANLVNEAGLVRGGTQRLFKLKLAEADPEIITKAKQKTKQRVSGLVRGDTELELEKFNDPEYQALAQKLESEWTKVEQILAQPNPDRQQLLTISEDFFKLSDEVVSAAEAIANKEERSQNILEIVGIAVGLGAVILSIFIVFQMTKFLTKTSTELATSSTEIAASIAEQEKVVSQQATSVNQVTTTMEELGASSRQSAEQAITSASAAQKALELSNSGSATVQRTLEGINVLKDNVSAIAQKIMELTERTAQVSTISDLVADIANQTNILALNAAVEAARAGEQGKGFSVVAQEVRKLADQSKKSAEKINSLIRDIQSSINSTVMVTDEGTKMAVESIRLSKATAEAFQEILNVIQSISVNSQQISLSAKQQAVGVQQGVSAMNAINLGAREVASSVSQIRSAVQQLAESAQLLKDQV